MCLTIHHPPTICDRAVCHTIRPDFASTISPKLLHIFLSKLTQQITIYCVVVPYQILSNIDRVMSPFTKLCVHNIYSSTLYGILDRNCSFTFIDSMWVLCLLVGDSDDPPGHSYLVTEWVTAGLSLLSSMFNLCRLS